MQAYGPAFARVYNKKWNHFAQSIAPQIQALYEITAPRGQIDKTLLDLCCGNGILSRYFLEQGYRVTGLDLSESMLHYAQENNTAYIESGQTQFSYGDATAFALDKPVGLIVSTFDALNHLPDDAALQRCFGCVSKALLPGGLFVFDLNTRSGLSRWGHFSVDEDEDATIIYRGVYAPQDNRAWAQLSGFVRLDNGLYERYEETVYNTIFDLESVQDWLFQAGFDRVYFARSGDLATPVKDAEALPRAFIVALK